MRCEARTLVPESGITSLQIDCFKSNLIEKLLEEQNETQDELCEYHDRQILKYFCEKCSKMVCAECCLENHQNHPTLRIEVEF